MTGMPTNIAPTEVMDIHTYFMVAMDDLFLGSVDLGAGHVDLMIGESYPPPVIPAPPLKSESAGEVVAPLRPKVQVLPDEISESETEPPEKLGFKNAFYRELDDFDSIKEWWNRHGIDFDVDLDDKTEPDRPRMTVKDANVISESLTNLLRMYPSVELEGIYSEFNLAVKERSGEAGKSKRKSRPPRVWKQSHAETFDWADERTWRVEAGEINEKRIRPIIICNHRSKVWNIKEDQRLAGVQHGCVVAFFELMDAQHDITSSEHVKSISENWVDEMQLPSLFAGAICGGNEEKHIDALHAVNQAIFS